MIEPLTGPALRSAIRAILARPVTELPRPEQTEARELSAANGRKAAAMLKGSVWAVARSRTPHNRADFDREAVAADLRAGMPIVEVTAKHGCSDTTAKKIRLEIGIVIRPPLEIDRAAMLADLQAGMIMRDVAAKHGCGRSTVQRIANEARGR